MKVVLDTNVYLSAFLFRGTAAKTFEQCVLYHEIYVSQWILDEIEEKLMGKFQLSAEETEEVLSEILKPALLIEPTNAVPNICRDPDDNNVIQLAAFVDAQYLITGDKDLIILQKYQGTVILNPADFLKMAV